ncbi:MAG: Mur ligase family protein [Erysipelotrichaceae bacterium]|nr:Mur ligase family protein [Erysipelotrichaceae bacterium]MDD3810351.1 Mur ligase family protein [Erysipelotrichaceae bacterium]
MKNLPRISIGLDNFRACLLELGLDALEGVKIHVGGTNGKGSTVNFLCEALMTNYKVATFQTPELFERNDIIQIDKKSISPELFKELYHRYLWAIEKYSLCLFEAELVIAFSYFKDRAPDYIIVEVGLGGQKDPTNVLTYDLALITNVGLDHQEYLGSTLEQIATTKAGIIKNATPVITGATQDEVRAIFAEFAIANGCAFVEVGDYKYRDKILDCLGYRIGPLANDYQVKNIALAISALEYLRKNGTILQKDAIIRAIENSGLPGRFSQVNERLIVDGAHNVPGIEALLVNLKNFDDPLVVFNSFADKDYQNMYRLLLDKKYRVVIYYDDHPRSIRQGDLKGDSIASLSELEQLVSRNEITVVCGSLHFALKIYRHFKKQEKKEG